MDPESRPQHAPIAIVGIAAELPSGQYADTNLDHLAFFDFLMNEGQSYERIPIERYDINEFQGAQLGCIVAERGSFLKNITHFDHLEFGITSKDARAMSASTRKLIELSFLALLDSGIDYRGRNVGCFASGIVHDVLALGDMDEFEARGSFAGIPTQIANRISYHLDLLGPSVPTDTACSSTLTAMHLAVQAIRAGDCEAAAVGGCQLNHRFLDFVQYTQGGVLAPDGKCKPFDSSADGFSRSEAAAVVVIKPLEDAIRDGDKIYATILGTGINSTGSAAPANAPVGPAQEDAMKRAYNQADRSPSDVDYVEMHATGTALGDPTEANWVGRAFQRGVSDQTPLLVGSVKGNIGHTEITAFLASLCKVIGIFDRHVVPPNVNLRHPNPAIHWKEYNLEAPLVPTLLPTHSKNGKSLVSIASSGIGGSNGHCVVEEPPERRVHNRSAHSIGIPVLLMAGALSPRAMAAVSDSIGTLVKDHPNEAASLSTNLGRRVRQMTWRSFAIVNPESQDSVTFAQPVLSTRIKPIVGFILSGQGPQHIKMGQQLFGDFAVFRESVLAMDAVYTDVVGVSLIASTGLFDSGSNVDTLPDIWPIAVILPAIAMIQVALIDLLRSFGIAPDFVLGHSAGETAMLYACGAASKAMTMELAIVRGKALAVTESLGATMAALSCGPATAEKLIADIRSSNPGHVVQIACYNTDEAVTVAGSAKLIDELIDVCKSQSIAAQRLRTNVAVHSAIMDHCESEFRTSIHDVFVKYDRHVLTPKGVQIYSTVTGRQHFSFDTEYFWRNTRQPVLFCDAMRTMVNDNANRQITIMEIGAHPVLSAYISSLGPNNMTVLCPMRRTKQVTIYHERIILLRSIGGFVAAGHNNVDFSILNGNVDHVLTFPLPPYPFSRKHIPVTSKWTGQQQVLSGWNGPLNYGRLRMNSASHPDLAQHVMNGEPIMPATGFMEMALEFGAHALWDVKFHSFLSLSHDDPVPVRVALQGTHWTVSSAIADRHSNKDGKLHAEGHLSLQPISRHPATIDIVEIRQRCQEVSTEGFYGDLKYFAQYGHCFQLVKRFHRGNDEFLVEVDASRDSLSSAWGYRKRYRLDPAVLDACIHVTVHPLITGTTDPSTYYLPSRCSRFFLYNDAAAFTDRIFAYGCNGRWTPNTISYDVLVVNSQNVPICAFREMTVSLHAPVKAIKARYDMVYEPIASIKTRELPLEDYDTFPDVKLQESVFNEALFLYLKREEDIGSILESLNQADLTQTSRVWLFASAGYCAGVAKGFSRSLRRELLIPVRLVEIEVDWPQHLQKVIAMYLLATGIDEEEVVVTPAGVILAPRLRPVDDVDSVVPSNTSKRWCLQMHEGKPSLSHVAMPIVTSGEILVYVQSVCCGSEHSNVWSFMGRTDTGEPVVGITNETMSNVVVIPREHILPLPRCHRLPLDQAVKYVLQVAATSLTVGPLSCVDRERLKGATMLLTHAETPMGSLIREILQRNGLQVHPLDSNVTLTDLLHVGHKHFDFVMSGHVDPDLCAAIRTLYSESYSIFFWNSEMDGLPFLLRRRKRVVQEALENALEWLPSGGSLSSEYSPIAIQDVFKRHSVSDTIPDRSPIFSGDKAYLLIGGIGSLGLQIAAWMYENGARHIVLTSRSGCDSLIRAKNVTALRTLKYLRSLPDLKLTLSSCDASSAEDTERLVANLTIPVAGCMLLAAVLEDKPLAAQTRDSFAKTFAAKTGTYYALRRALDIQKLDFLIGFTSISGMFGNAGQTSYASANTALESLLSQHGNAFCMVTPMVLDTSIAFGDLSNKTVRNTKVRHIAEWGVSSRDICRYIADGLRRLRNGPLWMYVPDLDWRSIRDRMGVSRFFEHLIPQDVRSDDSALEVQSPAKSVLQILLKVLEVPEQDFSAEVPLTAYGLDSLSAQRIASMVRPFVRVTQLQLLADMTFSDIVARMSSAHPVTAVDPSYEGPLIDWGEVIKSDEPIVKLRGGDGVPLFLIPGPSGRVDIFSHMAEQVTFPLYGIQVTSKAPRSLIELADYYFTHIKTVRAHGPYRIGAFCGGSILLFLLLERFLQAGDLLLQVALIDGSPLFYASPVWEIDQTTVQEQETSAQVEQRTLDFLINLYLNEPSSVGGHNYKRVAEETIRAGRGDKVSFSAADRFNNLRNSCRAHGKFIARFADPSEPFDPHIIQQRLIDWVRTFKHPITVYLADHGLRNLFPNRTSEWDHLGVELCHLNARVKVFSSGHFELLAHKEFISELDRNWLNTDCCQERLNGHLI